METYFTPSKIQLKCTKSKCTGTYKNTFKSYKFSKDFTWSVDWEKIFRNMGRRQQSHAHLREHWTVDEDKD